MPDAFEVGQLMHVLANTFGLCHSVSIATTDEPPLTVASLCSGYGGIEKGLELAGEDVRLIWHAETEPSSAAIHDAHWPDVTNIGDITTADWSTLETPDLLTAGYPCQPFSHAGIRQGEADDRHLWPHIAEAVRVLRPRRVLLENVAGHRSLGFGRVLGDLAALGYDCRWESVRASDVGACHQRERVFILATDTSGSRRQGQVVGEQVGGTSPARRAAPPPHTGGARARRDARAVPREADEPRRSDADLRTTRDARPVDATPSNPNLSGRSEGPGLRAGEPAGVGGGRLGDGDREDDEGPSPWSTYADGRYEPAVRRWEHQRGPCPDPTGLRGHALLVEWMMGLDRGWITDVIEADTTAVRIGGNGVVPQAAALAWTLLS